MLTQELQDKIIFSYTQDYQSLAELSRQYGVTTACIKKILINSNIHIRDRKEQAHFSNIKRTKSCCTDYFSNINTYTKAWLIGFLAADGTIRKERNEIKIGLSARDKEILEKIKKEVDIEKNIFEYTTSNGFDIVELVWSCSQHKTDLAKFGVVPNKTYLINSLPHFENDNYTLAYILGYFDGNGSISLSPQGYLRFRLCCYTEKFLQDIANFFQKKYGATYSLSKDHHRQVYELSISTTYAKNIFNDMYNLNTLHLDRKYQKYLEYKIIHETPTSDTDEKVR